MTWEEWDDLKFDLGLLFVQSVKINVHDGRERIFVYQQGKWRFIVSRSITNVVEVDKTDQERLNNGEISGCLS